MLQRGGDIPYAFSQDANFWYLTGIDEPDIILVMDRDKEYLIVPARSASREALTVRLLPEPLTRRSGIRTVLDDKEWLETAAAACKKVKHVATISPPPSYVEQYGIYTNPARGRLYRQRLKTYNSQVGTA